MSNPFQAPDQNSQMPSDSSGHNDTQGVQSEPKNSLSSIGMKLTVAGLVLGGIAWYSFNSDPMPEGPAKNMCEFITFGLSALLCAAGVMLNVTSQRFTSGEK